MIIKKVFSEPIMVNTAAGTKSMISKLQKSEWQKLLIPMQYDSFMNSSKLMYQVLSLSLITIISWLMY